MGRGSGKAIKAKVDLRSKKARASQTVFSQYGEHQITPGLIDSESKAYFTSGQCHAFAMALEIQEGWIAQAVDTTEAGVAHYCNRLPDGRFIDIEGVKTEEEMLKSYKSFGAERIREAEKNELEELGSWGWAEPDINNALSCATRIKEIYGIK